MNQTVIIPPVEAFGGIDKIPPGMSLEYFPNSLRATGSGRNLSLTVYYHATYVDFSYKVAEHKGVTVSFGNISNKLSIISFSDMLLNDYLNRLEEGMDFFCNSSNIPYLRLHYEMVFKLIRKYDKKLFLLAQ
jgi:hypothetical protein